MVFIIVGICQCCMRQAAAYLIVFFHVKSISSRSSVLFFEAITNTNSLLISHLKLIALASMSSAVAMLISLYHANEMTPSFTRRNAFTL